jgi:predicted nucleic acid-binding protein
MAASDAVRGRRLRTLQATQSTYVAPPIDEAVASAFAELVATARRGGRRPKLQDTWIAATAHALGVAVYTQDSDFDELSVDVVRVWSRHVTARPRAHHTAMRRGARGPPIGWWRATH